MPRSILVTMPNSNKKKLQSPTKTETAVLPTFAGLSLDHIQLPQSRDECLDALEEIRSAGVCGFDTEAKPTFNKGQKSTGPHVIQISLSEKCYIFQLHHSECEKTCAEIIESEQILKVGFGLKNDHSQIRDRLGISLKHTLDLDQTFREMGYSGNVGIRGAIGITLHQCFKKSKSTTLSNWATKDLSSRQLLYAANDVYAALKVMKALPKINI